MAVCCIAELQCRLFGAGEAAAPADERRPRGRARRHWHADADAGAPRSLSVWLARQEQLCYFLQRVLHQRVGVVEVERAAEQLAGEEERVPAPRQRETAGGRKGARRLSRGARVTNWSYRVQGAALPRPLITRQ